MSNEVALRAGILLFVAAAALFWLANRVGTPRVRRTSEWHVSNREPRQEYAPHRPILMPRSFYEPASKGENGRRRS